MTRKDETTKKTGLILIAILGSIYLYCTYINTKNSLNDAALQVAKTIEASLPKKELQELEGKTEDINKPEYKVIKNSLITLARVNTETQFIFLYTKKNDDLCQIADSELENSKDYSPPGITGKCTNTSPVYSQAFTSNKPIVSNIFSKIWGSWIMVLVPVKHPVSKKTIAVLALGYSITSWKYALLFQVAQSILIIVLTTFLFLLLIGIKTKNKLLKLELDAREKADSKLKLMEEKHNKIMNIKDYN